jgi:hypothetical protein
MDSFAVGALLASVVIPVLAVRPPIPGTFFNFLTICLGWYAVLLVNAWLAWPIVSDTGKWLIGIGLVWSTAVFAGGLLWDLIIRLTRRGIKLEQSDSEDLPELANPSGGTDIE